MIITYQIDNESMNTIHTYIYTLIYILYLQLGSFIKIKMILQANMMF